MRRLVVLAVLLAAACSGSEPDPGSAPANAEAAGSEQLDASTTAAAGADEATSTESTTTVVAPDDLAPAVRVPVAPSDGEPTNWIARVAMTDTAVDLTWSAVENTDRYEVWRIPTAEADYDAIAEGDFGAASLVYDGDDLVTTDTTVEPDTFYTYVLIAWSGDAVSAPRWTEALTVFDEIPPSPITGLTAEVTDDGVLLSWNRSTDNVEFAAYNVSLDDGDQRTYIGGGADESATSFLDPEPLDGPRTYEVVAVDFHDNRSDPAQITVG